MEAYSEFARVYDQFMDQTPYESWCEFLTMYLKKEQISDGLVVDLGCGTGTLTRLLAEQGYDMIGVDASMTMLQIAREKENLHEILYLNQDMRELELYGTVRAVISVCDSLNYLLEEEDLMETFRKVNNYLDPGGFFIFDFNTLYKYQEVIGDAVIAENREDCSFIWENYFHEEEKINEYQVTIFQKQEEGSCYEKFEEVHYQRGYTLQEMKNCLKKAGLIFVEAIDADTLGKVHKKSERIYVVAREYVPGKSSEKKD